MVYMLVLSRTVLVDKHCPTADPACVQWQLQLELSKVIFVVINTQLVLCYSLMTHVCVLAGRSSQCAAFRQCSVWYLLQRQVVSSSLMFGIAWCGSAQLPLHCQLMTWTNALLLLSRAALWSQSGVVGCTCLGSILQTWLILPVVICLSQRLSHACLSISFYTAKLRMAH